METGRGVGDAETDGSGDGIGDGAAVGDVHKVLVVHVYGVVSCDCSVHSHELIVVPSNAAPDPPSPEQVVVARSSRPFAVSIPEDEPHTGQLDPGSDVEKRPT